MTNTSIKILILGILILSQSCQKDVKSAIMEERIWKTGWQMIEYSWDEKYELAEVKFDSLLSTNKKLSDKFLIEGLKIKFELSKEKEVLKIFSNQSDKVKSTVCEQDFAKDLEPCKDIPQEKVLNEQLQLKIIELFLQDQAVRGNIMNNLISKHQIDTSATNTEQGYWLDPEYINVDEVTRNQLKEIFNEYGFPTRQLVGKDAMNGVFYIIQHSDGDKNWQKSQLPNIELAIKKGDLDRQLYAYLYDRIQVGNGGQQKYGTQLLNVDRTKKTVQLLDTEDLENLNQRRREVGLSPIETYKRLVLRQQ